MNDYASLAQVNPDVGTGSVCVMAKRRRPFYGRTRQTILGLLANHQGGKCHYSFDCCTNKLTVIAHLDHDPSNDAPSNLAVSCEPCNKRISNLARGKAKRSVEESVYVSPQGERVDPDRNPIGINRVKEPMFLTYAKSSAGLKDGPVELSLFVREAAHYCGVSVVTIRERYVPKHDVPGGLLRTFLDRRRGVEFVELRRRADAD